MWQVSQTCKAIRNILHSVVLFFSQSLKAHKRSNIASHDRSVPSTFSLLNYGIVTSGHSCISFAVESIPSSVSVIVWNREQAFLIPRLSNPSQGPPQLLEHTNSIWVDGIPRAGRAVARQLEVFGQLRVVRHE